MITFVLAGMLIAGATRTQSTVTARQSAPYERCLETTTGEAPLVVGVDEQSRTLVRLPKDVPRRLPLDQRFSTWLPYSSLEPLPSAAFSYPTISVPTAAGLVSFCIPLEARLEGGAQPTGIIYVAFDPTRKGAPSYPFDAAITNALEAGLLRGMQRDLMRAVQGEVEASLSYRYWQRRFGGDASCSGAIVSGRRLLMDVPQAISIVPAIRIQRDADPALMGCRVCDRMRSRIADLCRTKHRAVQ